MNNLTTEKNSEFDNYFSIDNYDLSIKRIKVKFAKQLKSLRISMGIKPGDLALKAGISKSALYRVESNYSDYILDTEYRIAHALGIEISKVAVSPSFSFIIKMWETLDKREKQALMELFKASFEGSGNSKIIDNSAEDS